MNQQTHLSESHVYRHGVKNLNVEEAVEEYRDNLFPQYDQFRKQLKQLFKTLIGPLDIEFIIESRTKNPEHFRKKISRPEKHYADPLKDVTDLAGVRLILQRVADAKRIVDLVESEFDVDKDNSIYKNELEVDKLGYLPLAQLVIEVAQNRVSLTEWSPFKGFKAEIQIRTILQHAWDVISRRYDYQVEADVPPQVRRRLLRLSALFELGDDELERFAFEVSKQIEQYQETLGRGDQVIEVNVDSLKAYIEASSEVQYWNDFMRTDREIGHQVNSNDWGDLSRDVRIAHFLGLKYIKNIDSTLKGARGWGEIFFRRFFVDFFAMYHVRPRVVTTVVNGVVTLLMLASNAEKLDEEKLSKDFGFGDVNYARYFLELANAVKQKGGS